MWPSVVSAPVCAITGANGYLGRCLTVRMREHGWRVLALTRDPKPGNMAFRLGEPLDPSRLAGVSALIHCAYDFMPLKYVDIHKINVEGSARLFDAARDAGVKRLVHISTMSAFEGCKALYGRAKLKTENIAAQHSALILRPGLIYGRRSGGMFGRLIEQVRRSRVIPLIGCGSQILYLSHEKDLAALIGSFCEGEFSAPSTAVIAAHCQPWTFREILEEIGRSLGKDPHFVCVPWRPVWLALRCAEACGIRLGFRSDSLVSLMNQNPCPHFDVKFQSWFQPFRVEEMQASDSLTTG